MTMFFNSTLKAQDMLCLPCEEATIARGKARLSPWAEWWALRQRAERVAESAQPSGIPEHVIGYEGAVARSPAPEPDEGPDLERSRRRTPARW